VDAHEFAAVFAASQRKFGAGKRFNQRFPICFYFRFLPPAVASAVSAPSAVNFISK
jgi:hypothetical protein